MRYLYTAVALLVTLTAQAQIDSVRTEYKTESTQSDTSAQRSGSRFVKAYRKFIQAQVEKTTLIKVGALPRFGYAGYVGPAYGVSTQVDIERKLIPAVSVMVSLHTNYTHLGNLSDEVTMRGVLAGRWYYAQNRRMRAGLSANNFSNQYLMLQTSRSLLSRTRLLATGESYGLKANDYVSLGYGSQRRLGRFGYIDLNVGPGYLLNNRTDQSSRFTINVSFSVGLGL